MKELLSLSGIRKIFPGVVALDQMNFQLLEGEIHAVCGENGAGKSTLMKVVTGVYKPDEGTIKLYGREIKFQNPLEAFEQGIAIIYQETSLFEEMTVLENLFLGREITKKTAGMKLLDYKEMRKRASEIFTGLGVDIPLERKIKHCGIAQKQMIEIAKALTFDAKILILDEPTASLTKREVDGLFSAVSKLKKTGVGVVYISHRIEDIFTLCDRVTVIRDGRYINTMQVCQTNKDRLVTEMVGRSMDNYYPKADIALGGTLLEVENFTDHAAVRKAGFTIRKGEIVGFAGLAGSGRTELALAICGLVKGGSGSVALNGKPLAINSYQDAMENGIVYVSEDRGKYGVVLEMSIKDNITLPQIDKLARLGLIETHKEKAIAEKMRCEMGIKSPDTDFIVCNLSGGNQQKVSVGKALALNPKVLILDEPTRGVDVGAKAEIHRMISGMVEKGLSILMISSELPELLGMCDRIYVMRDGQVAGCFERKDATQEKILSIALEAENCEVVPC